MIPFGLVFIGMAIYAAVYNHHNATFKDRYSFLLLMKTKRQILLMKGMEKTSKQTDDNITGTSVGFCPYCGKPVDSGFDFCPKCGKILPD